MILMQSKMIVSILALLLLPIVTWADTGAIYEERAILEEKLKQLEAQEDIDTLKKQIAEEKRIRLARTNPSSAVPKKKSKAKCPSKMSFVPGGVYLAGKVNSLKDMSINALCMDKYEVKQKDYERVIGNNPSEIKKASRHLNKVNWEEAKTYCEKVGKRLPTEWEWEKAARAGTTTKYYWGKQLSSGYAWNGADGKESSHPVGHKKPNAFGLYDMSGNVWEWTSSDYDANKKVLRGGSWHTYPEDMRASFRAGVKPAERSIDGGFRCVK
jgi:sulfatase modifying factor 1